MRRKEASLIWNHGDENLDFDENEKKTLRRNQLTFSHLGNNKPKEQYGFSSFSIEYSCFSQLWKK